MALYCSWILCSVGLTIPLKSREIIEPLVVAFLSSRVSKLNPSARFPVAGTSCSLWAMDEYSLTLSSISSNLDRSFDSASSALASAASLCCLVASREA